MIVDTNILLRLIEGPDGPQYPEVSKRLAAAVKADERINVTAATIHEVVFVLQSSATGYGYGRTEITREILWLLDTIELSIEHSSALRDATTRFGGTLGIDFHDLYLAALGRESDQPVYSLDADFGQL